LSGLRWTGFGWEPCVIVDEAKYVVAFPVDPVARKYLRTIGQSQNLPGIPAVYPGSEQRPCSACGMAVWVGPRCAAAIVADPAIRILCVRCAVPLMLNGTADVSHLANPESDWDRGN